MIQDPASQLYRPYLSTWLRDRMGSPELQPGAVFHRTATVLYADLSGFTQLTAAFASLPDGAEQLHDALNRFYSVLSATVAAFGGDLATIAGDALTAWWPERIDMETARRCAVAMQQAVGTMPPIPTPQGPFRLDLRVGVSAGEVAIILAGLPSHGVHLVLAGPAILAAAEAERRAQPGTIFLADWPSRPAAPVGRAPAPQPPHSAGVHLTWEHFLPPGFAERLRLNELVAEYRRCLPVFAAFQMPRRPEELHALVAQVQTVVLRWGGWLNEIEVGDKGALLVLLFGAPLARGDDASRAVGCCLELRDRGLISRAGVTLGILFVGAVGSPQRRVYTAQGDDMNLAAHLMQEAAPGEVLVSGRVRQDIVGRYATSEMSLLVTKGHAEGVPVARVIAAGGRPRRGGAMAQRYLPEASVPVGRAAEQRLLGEAAHAAAAGQPALALVEGESGIGKSFLLQDLIGRWLERGWRSFSSECSSGDPPTPLLAWRPILLDLLEIDEGGHGPAWQQQIERALRRSDLAGPESGALLARLLGDQHAPARLDQREIAAAATLLIELVRKLLAAGPLLLLIEDIHWADEHSLQLAADLLTAAVAEGAPLLLVLSHRPLDGPPPPALEQLRGHPACRRISLERLSSAESAELIQTLLGVSSIHPELQRHVERHTEGQPLFIKEYLRVLRQNELVLIEENSARLARQVVGVQVSSSAQGVIQARVDRLDESTRQTMKVAAVIGRSFSLRLLADIHPGHPTPAQLSEQLDALCELEIINRELEGPEPVFRFKYGITHEVAYTSLLFGQRRQLHGAVADWYHDLYREELAADSAPMAVYDLLITHLGRADQRQRQAAICRAAASQALRRYAGGAALGYIEQALIYAGAPADRLELLILRVAINERLGDQSGQAEDIGQLELLAGQLGQQLRQVQAGAYRLRHLLAMGMSQVLLGQAVVAARRARLALRAAGPAERRQIWLAWAASLDCLASAYAARGEPGRARRIHGRALARCMAAAAGLPAGPQPGAPLFDPRSLAARCLGNLSRLSLAAGQPAMAVEQLGQALELTRAAEDWGAESEARGLLGAAYLARGAPGAAREQTQAALETSRAIGDRAGQAMALRQLAAIELAAGNPDEAQRCALHALAIATGAHARAIEALVLDDMARIAEAQGQSDEAEAARGEAARVRGSW